MNKLLYTICIVLVWRALLSTKTIVNVNAVNLETIADSLCRSYLSYYPEEKINSTRVWKCSYNGDYAVTGVNETIESCPKSTIVEINYDWIQTFENKTHNLFGYVSYSLEKSLVVVSFRGTDKYSLKNWMENLSILRTMPYPYNPDVEVHRGFYHAFSSVRFMVWEALKTALSICDTCNRVHFTGHSLGGASATVAMGEAILDGFRELYSLNYRKREYPEFVVELHTFGQPRIGNVNFTHLFENYTTWRVVNDQDMVPHIPPVYSGYQHVASELWETPTSLKGNDCYFKQLSSCNGSGEDENCADSYRVAHSIADHYSYMAMSSPYTEGEETVWNRIMPMHTRMMLIKKEN